MGLVAKSSGGGDFDPAPQGTHLAVCNQVIDLGNQVTEYMGAKKTQRRIYIRWELPDERFNWIDGDNNAQEGPRVIGKTYTLSLHEKANLRKDLEGWRGKSFTEDELNGFDVFNVAGINCQVTVTHKEKDGKTYANVTSVAGWPKGLDRKPPELPVITYSTDDGGDTSELPDWIQQKLSERVPDAEEPPTSSPDSYGADLDDEIPF